MARIARFVGMDVHAETIAVAIAEGRSAPRSLGTIPNRPEAIRKLIAKLGDPSTLRVCYEAGPTGYVLYWQLTRIGVHCDVIAPSLVPKMPGDRIKTDRRDAEKLARAYRAGDLSPVWVPDAEHESLRDLVRAREAAKEDELSARHRLTKYLLRYGQRPAKEPLLDRSVVAVGAWTEDAASRAEHRLARPHHGGHHQSQRIERLEGSIDRAVQAAPAHLKAIVDALQSLRGVAKITAVTLATEFGTFRRFEHASEVMSYTGLVPSEHSSGPKSRRGKITKTGNSHLRRVLVESAWHYRHRPHLCLRQRKLQQSLPPKVSAIAWRAQERLHRRYRLLSNKSKPAGKVVTALARELVGFIRAIGTEVESNLSSTRH